MRQAIIFIVVSNFNRMLYCCQFCGNDFQCAIGEQSDSSLNVSVSVTRVNILIHVNTDAYLDLVAACYCLTNTLSPAVSTELKETLLSSPSVRC